MAAEIPILGRVDRNSEFSASENADCNTSENGAYDVEEVNTTTGARVVGFAAGVGRGSIGAGGSLVAVSVGVEMGPSSVGVCNGVGIGSAVGVGIGVGCSAGARVATMVGAEMAEGAATSLLQAANNTRPDRVKHIRDKRRRDNRSGSSYSDFTKSSIGWTDLDTTKVYLRRRCNVDREGCPRV